MCAVHRYSNQRYTCKVFQHRRSHIFLCLFQKQQLHKQNSNKNTYCDVIRRAFFYLIHLWRTGLKDQSIWDKLLKPLHKHQPSPSLLWMQLKWKRLSVLMPLLAVMTKIHQRSRSGRPLWGMKVSQQREDQIYFIAWLKSIWCVRCWRWRDGKLLRVSSSPTIEWL